MKSIKKIKAEIENTTQIKSIVEVFEEISAIKMKNIRDEILLTRDFLERLADLSGNVGSDLSIVKNSEVSSACVYLSSSGGMYGDLPEKIFNAFVNYIDNKTDVFICGKQGKAFVEKYRPNLKFEYYEDEIDILKKLLNFGKITVFYGRFKNIINQEAVSKSIMGDYEIQFNNMDKKELALKQFKYIYEPSVVEVSTMFANEIKTSVFEGMIKENNLAKTASRLMHLDKAYESIEEKLNLLELIRNRENKKVEDKKQQERIKRIWV